MIEAFRDAATRLFEDLVTPSVIEAAEAGRWPAAPWEAAVEAGFGLVFVPEAHGGVGGGLPEAAAILAVAGAHAVPGPLLELMLGNALLAASDEAPSDRPLALAFAAVPRDGGPTMVRDVSWAAEAGRLLVLSDSGLASLVGTGLDWHDEVPDACGEPRSRLALPTGVAWRSSPGFAAEAWLRRAALLRGAQMIGAMRWCLDRTIAYAGERRQFGREIGRFQAVQQMVAEMASNVVAAHAMLDAAIAAPDDVRYVAAARSRLADAADIVFAHAHQIHGAIGFSHEYVLHFRTRRLMAWRDQFGSTFDWRRRLAAGFVGCNADAVWSVIAE